MSKNNSFNNINTSDLHVIYISGVVSNRLFGFLFDLMKEKPSVAPQKFHYLLLTGMTNFCNSISAVSIIPLKSSFWDFKILKRDRENKVDFFYLPVISFGLIKHFIIFSGLLIYISQIIIRHRKSKTVLVCDILNLNQSLAVVFLSFIFRSKIVAIVTDIPDTRIKKNLGLNIFKWFHGNLSLFLLKKYDAFVFLTKYMNIYGRNKPSIILEGLVESNSSKISSIKENVDTNKVILYAGGLYEQYGVRMLLDAFSILEHNDAELHLYGGGDLVDTILNFVNKDSRIYYGGILPNDIIKEKLELATLLVNPRFTNERYTLFSFPSKNIEYMASGTPLLTTRLKGIPDEYFNFCYSLEVETVVGLHKKLDEILSYDANILNEFGSNARKFVLENKNNIFQGFRLLNFIKTI
jgi:glycosyltransferase involved in cell wall biosynthesis